MEHQSSRGLFSEAAQALAEGGRRTLPEASPQEMRASSTLPSHRLRGREAGQGMKAEPGGLPLPSRGWRTERVTPGHSSLTPQNNLALRVGWLVCPRPVGHLAKEKKGEYKQS